MGKPTKNQVQEKQLEASKTAAEELLQAQQRVTSECAKEIDAVLAKYSCRLTAEVICSERGNSFLVQVLTK